MAAWEVAHQGLSGARRRMGVVVVIVVVFPTLEIMHEALVHVR